MKWIDNLVGKPVETRPVTRGRFMDIVIKNGENREGTYSKEQLQSMIRSRIVVVNGHGVRKGEQDGVLVSGVKLGLLMLIVITVRLSTHGLWAGEVTLPKLVGSMDSWQQTKDWIETLSSARSAVKEWGGDLDALTEKEKELQSTSKDFANETVLPPGTEQRGEFETQKEYQSRLAALAESRKREREKEISEELKTVRNQLEDKKRLLGTASQSEPNLAKTLKEPRILLVMASMDRYDIDQGEVPSFRPLPLQLTEEEHKAFRFSGQIASIKATVEQAKAMREASDAGLLLVECEVLVNEPKMDSATYQVAMTDSEFEEAKRDQEARNWRERKEILTGVALNAISLLLTGNEHPEGRSPGDLFDKGAEASRYQDARREIVVFTWKEKAKVKRVAVFDREKKDWRNVWP